MSTELDEVRPGGCAAEDRSAGSTGGGGDATCPVTALRGATGDGLAESLQRSLSKKPTLTPPFRLSFITRAAWRLRCTDRPYTTAALPLGAKSTRVSRRSGEDDSSGRCPAVHFLSRSQAPFESWRYGETGGETRGDSLSP